MRVVLTLSCTNELLLKSKNTWNAKEQLYVKIFIDI